MEVNEPSAKYLVTKTGCDVPDWGRVKLGTVASFRTGPFGSALHKSDYVFGGVPVVNPMQIEDGRIKPTERMSVAEQAAERLGEFRLKAGDVVIGRRGEMGRCAFVQGEQEGWLCGTGSMIVRPGVMLDGRFLQRVLSANQAVRAIESASVGTTMINLNQRTLAELDLHIPVSLDEQTSIANALGDADVLVDSLGQLLTKKRQIKQGAMQELLTGKRRLRDDSEWHWLSLGEVATLKARIGWQGLTTAEYRERGDHLLVTGTEFLAGRVDWDSCHYVDQDRYVQDKNIQLAPGDVLVTKDGTIGKVALVETLPMPATLNSGVFVIRPRNEAFHPGFFYYLLASTVFASFLGQLSAGSTINHLYQKDFVNFKFRAPQDIEEQRDVFEVLRAIDSEIEIMDARITKARALKQAMAQVLLTGRIRLMEPT